MCRPSKDLELQYTVFCVRALVMDANIMRKTGNYFESTGYINTYINIVSSSDALSYLRLMILIHLVRSIRSAPEIAYT